MYQSSTHFQWCVHVLCFLWVFQKSNSPSKRKLLCDQVKGEILLKDETGRDNDLEELLINVEIISA